jgi:hypothetical protein
MAKASNMSAPVTRGELRDELKLLRTEFKQLVAPLATKAELAPLATKAELAPLATKAELEAAVAKLATKAELEAAVAKLATKAELAEAIAPLATKAELEICFGALLARTDRMQRELQLDLARHANALHEWLTSMLRAHDEKYADLPARVNRLESAVFTPERR